MADSKAWRSFLLDEDLPRSLAAVLRAAGLDAVHVYELGLTGRPDAEIRKQARESDRTLVTRDVGMIDPRDSATSNVVAFALVRLPMSVAIDVVKQTVVAALVSLAESPPGERMAVIEPGRIRLRGRLFE